MGDTDFRLFRLWVSRRLIDKNAPADPRAYTESFEAVELNLDGIETEVKKGHALAPVCNGRRSAANFVCADIAWVDVDDGMTLDEARTHPLVRDHAAIIYTTASHTPERHRFRIGFPLAERITDPREIAALQRSLALRLKGDPAATDAARISFGNRAAQVWKFPDRQLATALQAELIAQSIRVPARGAAIRIAPETTRSALRLAPDQQVMLSHGQVVAFSSVVGQAPLFCPFHNDDKPSAFAVTGRRGGRGIHCSTCRSTFWCDDPNTGDDFDPYGFEDELIRLQAEHGTHAADGPLAALLGLDGRARINVVSDGAGLAGPLPPGLTFVRAPKGVGKTEAVKAMLGEGVSALMVLHRRTLTRQVSRRLGLDCYLEVDDVSGDRVGICFDSLSRIPVDRRYVLLVIDEVEQVLAHILGDTIEVGQRVILFRRLVELVRTAKSVVVMDADIGWCSFLAVTRMRLGTTPAAQGDLFRPDSAARVALNVSKPGEGKKVHVFRSREHLVSDLIETLKRGERVFVAANTKAFADKLETTVRRLLGDVPCLLVTSATVSNEQQQTFLTDPAGEALKYQAIITSPAAGTGLDITFPNREVKIDGVYGFCEADVVTHWDFDQHVSRVRQPGAVKVWVSPRTLHYDTHRDVVRDDLLRGRLRTHMLLQAGEDRPELISDDLLIEMATLKVAEARWSKNNIKKNYRKHKQRLGFEIVDVEPVQTMAAEGREMLQLAKRLGAEELVARVLAAEPLSWSGLERVSGTVQGGGRITQAEHCRLERTRLEMFYRRPATTELIELDDRGRCRGRVRRFQAVTEALLAAPPGIEARDAVIAERERQIDLIVELLSETPVVRNGAWNLDATFTGEDLGPFRDFIERNRRAFETQLDQQVRRDLRSKPMSQLGNVLKMLGLAIVFDEQEDERDTRRRFYKLDPAAFARMSAIAGRRRHVRAEDFMRETYPWFDDSADEAENFFDGEPE